MCRRRGVSSSQKGMGVVWTVIIAAVLIGGGYTAYRYYSQGEISDSSKEESAVATDAASVTTEPSIIVVSPKEGTYKIGSTMTISWNPFTANSLLKLQIGLKDSSGSFVQNIIRCGLVDRDSGRYVWNIPATLHAGTYIVYVSTCDGRAGSGWAGGNSAVFNLTASVSTEATTSWKTYRNEKYGFEFRYSAAREGFGVFSNDFNVEAPVASAVAVANPDVDNPNRNPLFNVRVQGGEQGSAKSFAERVRAENIQASVLTQVDIGGRVAYAFTVPAGYFVVNGTTVLIFSSHTVAVANVLDRFVALIYFPDDQRSRSIFSTFRFTPLEN